MHNRTLRDNVIATKADKTDETAEELSTEPTKMPGITKPPTKTVTAIAKPLHGMVVVREISPKMVPSGDVTKMITKSLIGALATNQAAESGRLTSLPGMGLRAVGGRPPNLPG